MEWNIERKGNFKKYLFKKNLVIKHIRFKIINRVNESEMQMISRTKNY